MTTELRFFNRYTRQLEAERVYGERALRWAYETGLGRLSLKAFITRPWFSLLYGWRMSRPRSGRLIQSFVRAYGLDPAEFLESPESYRSFNDFFARKLRDSARIIDSHPESLVFPADGRHLLIPDLQAVGTCYLKGHHLRIEELLAGLESWERWSDGSVVISRLCPVDYHRFHFPYEGRYTRPRLQNGPLYSVNPIAVARRPSILWENKRWVSHLEGSGQGREIACIEVGATMVGSVTFTASWDETQRKGQEKGFFSFGGSCVVTCFPRGAVQFAEDLLEQSANGFELYAHMGDVLGRWTHGTI